MYTYTYTHIYMYRYIYIYTDRQTDRQIDTKKYHRSLAQPRDFGLKSRRFGEERFALRGNPIEGAYRLWTYMFICMLCIYFYAYM